MTDQIIPHYAGDLAILIDRRAMAGKGRGILFMPAQNIETTDVVTMVNGGRGVCTITLNEGAAMRLGLYPQGEGPRAGEVPYFVNSVESVACEETGISAKERAITLRTVASPEAVAKDIVTPGHIMVQVARNILREGAGLSELANAFLSARGIARFAAWIDILDDTGEIGDSDWCVELGARLGLACFDAGEVRCFAGEKLAAWDEVVRFSNRHFDVTEG
ncbi:3,4-dihydroxy-2-butanone-4-phosphate synthase [Sphingobium aromaticivastans]|uniref:3,4-dihydroxy-2-butanone-4-phosphate synthase n=1 Tax=Sphingobium aromaticivastans TaxID=1778665 RepID=UPI00301805C1